MTLADGVQLHRFACFGAWRPCRPRERITHREIIAAVRILMVTSEAQPFAKTGGLADVLGALPRALVRIGHEVDVVIPRYRGITSGERIGSIRVALGGQVTDASLWSVVESGVRTIFIDHPPYFDRDYLYGVADRDYADNAERFAFLSQAAIEWAATSSPGYDVVHV